jgi:hypothetical protein
MRRIVLLMTVALMMAVMMVVSAAPAFALPPNPVRGQQVSAVARYFPTDPLAPPYSRGKAVSNVARGSSACSVYVDSCPVT